MGALSDQSGLLKPKETMETVITVHDNGSITFTFMEFSGQPVDLPKMRDLLLTVARRLSQGAPGLPPPGALGVADSSGLLGPTSDPLPVEFCHLKGVLPDG